jgi:NADH-quinone oxidoreductase subunit I
MIVKRAQLSWWERLYVPTILAGIKVTWRHFRKTLFGGETAAQKVAGGFYPEVPWTVQPGYRGAPYLVRDQDGHTKCVSCQLCEFVCPPKAIKIIPPGPGGQPAERQNAEKMPQEFEINMLRCIFCGFCQEVCPEEAIFLLKDYSLSGHSRDEMIYDKEKLLALGGTHAGVKKREKKKQDAEKQEAFPPKN